MRSDRSDMAIVETHWASVASDSPLGSSMLEANALFQPLCASSSLEVGEPSGAGFG